MKLKKFSAFLSILLLLNCVNITPIISFAENDSARITFGKTIKSEGISSQTVTDIKVYGGVEAAVIDPLNSQTELKLNLSGAFENIEDGSSVDLKITYFDDDNAKAILYYAGVGGNTAHPERLYTEDTGTWKTKTFHLQNPKFNKTASGADVRFSLSESNFGTSGSPLIVSEIEVIKTGKKSVYDAKIITNRYQDAYFSDDEPMSFDVNIGSLSGIKRDSNTAKVTYSITNDIGDVFWTKTEENVTVPYKTTVAPENVPYGILYFNVLVENEELHYKSEYKKEFSHIIAAPKNEDWGAATHWGSQWGISGIDEGMYLLSKAGAGFLRDGVHWNEVEKSKGSFALPVGKQTENATRKKYGLKELAVVAYGNPVWQPGIPKITYMPETDEAIEAFANNAGKLAETGYDYFEIWNEPNTTGFNSGNTSWDIYSDMVIRSAKKIKAVNPDAKIVPGSIVSIPDVPYGVLEEIFASGAGDYMDAFCIHPYIWDASPAQTNFHGKMEKLRKFIDDKGYPDVEIWATEMGWGAGEQQAWTFEDQAAYLAQSYIVFKAAAGNGKFVWYDAVQDGLSETNREHNFGIIHSWGYPSETLRMRPRKAVVALANMNNLLTEAEYVDYEVRNLEDYSYHYKMRDGRDVYALFSSSMANFAGLKTDRESVTVIDLYGNERTLYAKDGVLNFVIGESTQYIVGENLDLKFTEPTVYADVDEIQLIYGEEKEVNFKQAENLTKSFEILGDALNVEVTEDGNAKVSLSEMKKSDDDWLRLSVKDGEKLILSGQLPVEYKDAIDVQILNVPYNDVNYNRWVGTLVITNNSEYSDISGKMIFDEPDFFAKKLHPVNIPNVKPGETKRIKFHLPEILKKQVYDLSARIILDSGFVKSFNDRIDFAVAKYAENIVIDGVMSDDEWVRGTALAFDDTSKYWVSGNDGQFKGLDDLSGEAVVAYDEENIYLGIKVIDDTFYCVNANNGIWADDSVQCSFAYNYLNGEPDTTVRTEFGIALTPEGEQVYTYSVEDISIAQGRLLIEDFGGELKIKRDGNVTTYELKMPLVCLFQRSAKVGPGYRVAFTMAVNDNDGNDRKGAALIADGIVGLKNIELFTFLQFMDK